MQIDFAVCQAVGVLHRLPGKEALGARLKTFQAVLCCGTLFELL